MNWEELIQRLKYIPENRRQEPAVFRVNNDDVWLIDDVDYTEGDWELLESHRIFKDEDNHNPTLTLNPIQLTP